MHGTGGSATPLPRAGVGNHRVCPCLSDWHGVTSNKRASPRDVPVLLSLLYGLANRGYRPLAYRRSASEADKELSVCSRQRWITSTLLMANSIRKNWKA